MSLTASEVFRAYEVDGVPSSGNHKVKKADAIAWGTWLESFLTATGANAGVVLTTRAALYAVLTYPARTMAWVIGDPVVAYNGIYQKIGNSGTGSWTRVGDLPYSFILASDVGAGTPSAIQATTSIPVSASALILLNVFDDYVGTSATVSFNGDAPLTIKTNSGENVQALVGGSVIYGVISGSTFRLANDEAIANLLYAARDETLAARDDAEGFRDDAEAIRDTVADLVDGQFPNVQRFAVGAAVQSVNLGNTSIPAAAVKIFINGVYQFGDTWSIAAGVVTPVGGTWPGDGVAVNMEVVTWQNSSISVVEAIPVNGSVSRAKLDTALGSSIDFVTPMDYGAVGDGVTDDGAAVVAAVATGKNVKFPAGKTFLMDGVTIEPIDGQNIYGPGTLKKTTAVPGYTSTFIRILDKTNVVVDGVQFNCVGPSREFGVTIENSDDIAVRNCRSTGNETFCFVWKNSYRIDVRGNFVAGGQLGIGTGGDATGNVNGLVTNVSIADNFITGCDSEGIDINWDTQRTVISGNVLYANNVTAGEEEIDIGGGACRDITVVGNVIDGGATSHSGITVKLGTVKLSIVGNVLRNFDLTDTEGHGIRIYYDCADIGIESNDIYSAYYGIRAFGSSDYVQIKNNRIWNIQRQGVSIGGDGQAITNPQIDGNIISQVGLGSGAATDLSGIQITADVTHFSIQGNSIINAGGYGVVCLSGSVGGLIKGNDIGGCSSAGISAASTATVIEGNKCRANGTEGIQSTGSHCGVSGNIVWNNGVVTDGSYGIQIGSGANYTRVIGNDIFDDRGTKRQNGLRFVGAADRCIVTGNISYGNKTTNLTGDGSLTNSVVANNITA